eukprot:m.1167615 g.1167615  ORF g.1167615 m.1167615 type:complete len:403 (+) comp24508_c0_seq4:190-1398(+)
MLNLLQFLCLASALLQYPHSLGSTVGSTRTSATSTTTTSVPAIFQNETLHSLAPGTVRINVFRATSASTALSLANTNAADAEGEIGFLGNDCIRRRKGEDVVSPCDGTGVISHFVVVVDVPFSCYIMMNDGQCDGCLSSDAPCSVCTSSSPNCLAVAESTGGHVGMTRPVDGGAGWWYSFQAMSECNDNETIGDNGCTWKIESVPKSVRVCCVNIFNQSTFLDSFDACDAVDVSDSTIDADGSWSCDTTTTETGFLGSSTTTLSSATSSQSIRTTATTITVEAAGGEVASTSNAAPHVLATSTTTLGPIVLTNFTSSGPASSSIGETVSVGDDAGIVIGAAVACALVLIIVAYVLPLWRRDPRNQYNRLQESKSTSIAHVETARADALGTVDNPLYDYAAAN